MEEILRQSVAFAMVVGPGEAEIAIDSLEGVMQFYPEAAIWIRDDRTSDGTWEKLEAWAQDRPIHLTRNRIPQKLQGINKSFCDLLLDIVDAGDVPEIIIKFDPDAVLLRRGLIEAFQAKFASFGPGMCGVYKIAADGSRRDYRIPARNILIDALPIGLGHNRAIRYKPIYYFKHLIRALFHGYSIGENILGGAMAIHRTTLLAMAKAGVLRVPEHYVGRQRAEDIYLPMGARSVGHGLHSINDHPDKIVAWIRAFRITDMSAFEFLEKGCFVVHPVKKQDSAMREVFGNNRLDVRKVPRRKLDLVFPGIRPSVPARTSNVPPSAYHLR